MQKQSQLPLEAGVLAPAVAPAATDGRSLARDLFELTKPEITFLVAISVVAGFLIGSPDAVSWFTLAATVVGTSLASAGAGALNHYFEREHDRLMRRTASRPIPSGRINPTFAFRFGAALSVIGVALLCPTTNWLTATLAIATIALYLAAYTPLKRLTVHNTIVGTIPGALPALGGFTAATGTVSLSGWAVFLVLVLWQLPHFYSLSWMYRNDYRRGGFVMLSVDDDLGLRTAGFAFVSTCGLAAATFLLAVSGGGSPVFFAALAVLNVWLLVVAARFLTDRSALNARALLKATVRYIPLLVAAVVIDRVL